MSKRMSAVGVVCRAVVLFPLLAGCGGSGSTGLISEGAAIERALREGSCVRAGGVDYCAAGAPGAVAEGGQSAMAPGETAGPGPCPEGMPPCPGRDEVQFTVSGFAGDAACAAAARAAGSAEAWYLGPLVAVGSGLAAVPAFLPDGVSFHGAEVALLCFASAPPSLPARVDELADAAPAVVFVSGRGR